MFEAVFYSEPVPSSLETLTQLALVFDRVHFPGVYIPFTGVDKDWTRRELARLDAFAPRRPDDFQLRNAMVYATEADHIADFCHFTGEPGYPGKLVEGAEDLTKALELAIFGPPPEGFYPEYRMGWAKGLEGEEDSAVNAPGWIAYPASALLYSIREGLVLINDDPGMPVPSIGNATAKSNANVLSSVLALEAVRLVLPGLQLQSFEELAELRAESAEFATPFRREMLRLSSELNRALMSDATLEDVQREAQFLIETSVAPSLDEYAEALRRPNRPWHRRLVDGAKAVPQLIGNYATLPPGLATAKVLAALAGGLADVRDLRLEEQGYGKRTGLHYLLTLREHAGRGDV